MKAVQIFDVIHSIVLEPLVGHLNCFMDGTETGP